MSHASELAFAAVALLIVSALAGCGAVRSVTLHPTSAMVRIGGPGGAAAPPRAERYVMHVARNEAEAFQVLVRPARDLPGEAFAVEARVEVDRPCKSTAWPRLRLYQVLDVHHTGPAEHKTFKVPPRNLGWIPDVCWPTRRAVAQEHRPGEVTFLIDVYVPPGTTAGEWTWRVSFDCRTVLGGPAGLKLTVRVDPSELPVRLPFKTAVTWNWGIEKYLARKLTAAERLGYLDFFLRHRFTPASFWSIGPDLSDEEVRRVLAGGGNVFQLFGRGGRRRLTDKQKRDLAGKLPQWRAMMKQAGAIDYCYALVSDEPEEKHIPNLRDTAGWLKGIFPELKIWVATRPRKDLMNVVDCWDVVTAASTDFYRPHCYDAGELAEVRRWPGRPEYWWFYSVEPYGPHPNARIDDALVDSRAIGWMSFAAGVDGFEYFWATDWSANADLRDVPWPGKAGRWKLGLSGAGQLCYPGDDGLPIPSLRLVNLRDGMEDWAAFVQAGAALREAPAGNFRDPAGLAALRERARRTISRGRGR